MQGIVTRTIALLIAGSYGCPGILAQGKTVVDAVAQKPVAVTKHWTAPKRIVAKPATAHAGVAVDDAKKQESINQIITGLRGLFGDVDVQQENGGLRVRGQKINLNIGSVKVKPATHIQ